MGVRKKKTKRWDGIGWVLPGGRRVTCCFPGYMLPGYIITRMPQVTRWPPVTPPLRTATSLFSLFSFIPGVWVVPGPCVLVSAFLLPRFPPAFLASFVPVHRRKGPSRTVGRCPMAIPMAMPYGNAYWQFPMAKWTLELGSVHRYG